MKYLLPLVCLLFVITAHAPNVPSQPRLAELPPRVLTRESVNRREKALKFFFLWLLEITGFQYDLDTLADKPKVLSSLLAQWGRHMYSTGKPQYLFVEGINRCVDYHRYLKGQLAEAWDVVRTWNDLHPPSHRPPIPRLVLLSMVSVAIWKGWHFFAGVILLCFHAALRLGDVIAGQRKHLSLPSQRIAARSKLFLKVDEPKSRRRGARKQHASTEDSMTVQIWEFLAARMKADDYLYPMSITHFRKQWNEITTVLQIRSFALTPACMRGGGAVHLYLENTPIADIQWQMRIKDQTTLRHYLQEVAVDEIVSKLTTSALSNLKFLSSVSSKLLCDLCGERL